MNEKIIENWDEYFQRFVKFLLEEKTYGANVTSLKEGMVCLFYDALKETSETFITYVDLKNSFNTMKKSTKPNPKYYNRLYQILLMVWNKYSSHYGYGASMPDNIPEYVKWAFENYPKTRGELITINNAFAAANAIVNKFQDIGGAGKIIRDKLFDDIRERAVQIARTRYDMNIKADKWCPGDVYLLLNKGDIHKMLSATELNISTDESPSFNSYFGGEGDEGATLIAISLKEEQAQAGKAGSFLETVFQNEFKTSLKPEEYAGTSNNKNTIKVVASIQRYQDYISGKGRRKQSFINAIIKNSESPKWTIHGSILVIVGSQKVKLPRKKNEVDYFIGESKVNFQPGMSENQFYIQNKKIFEFIDKSIADKRSNLLGNSGETEKHFLTARKAFVEELKKNKINTIKETLNKADVTKMSDEKFMKGIITASEGKDYISTLSKKTAVYEAATLIMQRWGDDEKKLSPAMQKLAKITNPFVALAAYAIGIGGISPYFFKVFGHHSQLMGSVEFFDTDAEIDVDESTTNVTINDSWGADNFTVEYDLNIGNHVYNTLLMFRFSSGTLFIEVNRLKKKE